MTTAATALRTEALIDGEIAAALDALFKAQYALATNELYTSGKYGAYYAERAEAEHPALLAAYQAARGAYSAQADRYTGWSRFYLVLNSNGHIHRDTHCTTCFSTTRYAWLTELSGQTEAEVVAEYGAQLCTVCYPSAPVEWTDGSTRGRLAQAAKDARAAAKAERDHVKLVKAISDDVQGGVRVIVAGRPERFTTIASARAEITQILRYVRWEYRQYANGENEAAVLADLVAARLADLAERFPADGIKVETAEQILAKCRKTAAKD